MWNELSRQNLPWKEIQKSAGNAYQFRSCRSIFARFLADMFHIFLLFWGFRELSIDCLFISTFSWKYVVVWAKICPQCHCASNPISDSQRKHTQFLFCTIKGERSRRFPVHLCALTQCLLSQPSLTRKACAPFLQRTYLPRTYSECTAHSILNCAKP